MDGQLSFKQRLEALGRIIKGNPRLCFLGVYLISAVVALIMCPNGVALSVSISGTVATGSDFIPTIPYLLVGGLVIFICAISGGRADKGNIKTWGIMLVLMLIHLYFLRGSM